MRIAALSFFSPSRSSLSSCMAFVVPMVCHSVSRPFAVPCIISHDRVGIGVSFDHGIELHRLQLESSTIVQQDIEYCMRFLGRILQVRIRFIHFESYSIIFLFMYKFFTLALLSLSFFGSTFAAIDDTQVIDRE